MRFKALVEINIPVSDLELGPGPVRECIEEGRQEVIVDSINHITPNGCFDGPIATMKVLEVIND